MAKKSLRFRTFADVMRAKRAKSLPSELRLVERTMDGSVSLRAVKRGPGEDDYEEETLYETDTPETFLIEVAEAMGWRGEIS